MYPEGIPPALKRHTGWFFAGLVLCIAGALAGLIVSVRLGWPPLTSTLGMVGMITCVVVLGVRTQRDFALARRLRGQLCPTCMYDVTDLSDRGNCPECGMPYTKDQIVRQWRNADRSYQAKKLYTLDKDSSGN